LCATGPSWSLSDARHRPELDAATLAAALTRLHRAELEPHVLAGRVLHVHVASAVLAADEPSYWQRYALERVDRQRDGHALT
jgi:hypothetical protein